MPSAGKQQSLRERLIHRDTTNAVTSNLTQNVQLTIVHNTSNSMNQKEQALRFE